MAQDGVVVTFPFKRCKRSNRCNLWFRNVTVAVENAVKAEFVDRICFISSNAANQNKCNCGEGH